MLGATAKHAVRPGGCWVLIDMVSVAEVPVLPLRSQLPIVLRTSQRGTITVSTVPSPIARTDCHKLLSLTSGFNDFCLLCSGNTWWFTSNTGHEFVGNGIVRYMVFFILQDGNGEWVGRIGDSLLCEQSGLFGTWYQNGVKDRKRTGSEVAENRKRPGSVETWGTWVCTNVSQENGV